MKKTLLFLLITLVCYPVFPQKELTLKDAVLERWRSLEPDRLLDLQWNNEVDFYSYKDEDYIYIYNYESILQDTISLNKLNNSFEGEDRLITIPNINWIDSHSFTFKNRNNYYICNTKRGYKSSLLFSVPSNAQNIEINSQYNLMAYTIDNNLFISKDVNQSFNITNENNVNIVYGQAVHRYEFGIYKGTFWSRDGNYLAFYRKDESMVSDYPLMNISSHVGHVDNIKYPMAGMSSHYVKIGIYNSFNNDTIYLETNGPKDQYLTNICWGPNNEYIYVAVLNRGQDLLKLNQYNVQNGAFVKTLFEETSDKYIQPLHSMEFISSNQFLWRSERDGYDNFYLYSIDGNLIKKIAIKNHVVKDFYGFNNDNIYFSSYSKDGLSTDLWLVSVNKKYRKKIISDSSYHTFLASPSKSFFIDIYSSILNPGETRIINNKGSIIDVIHNAKNPLINYNIGSTELIKIKTENNISLNARIIKPYHFDPQKKYPALIYVYNGPMVQLLQNNWLANTPLWMYYLANQDYIIFTVDGRGSENRGRDFEQCIFGELGKIEMIDQIKGYEYLINLPYVNKDRIALHGWSYGGFMTTNLMLNYPQLFKCGVAGGPVTNWEFYEIMYTERFMNHPDENKEGYDKTNLINQVNKLQAPLLMIHGQLDDVVVPKHSLEFVKSAVDLNVQMDYFLYPGHKHNVRGKDRLHLIQKIIDYIRIHNQ